MTSVLGFMTIPGSGAYAASKHALESFSDAVRRELHPFGVSVSVIEPGFHRTALVTDGSTGFRKLFDAAPPGLQKLYGQGWVTAFEQKYNQVASNAAPASNVVDVYVTAITSQVPHTRYQVGLDCQIMNYVGRWLPTRLVDWLFALATVMPESLLPKGKHPNREALAESAISAVVDRRGKAAAAAATTHAAGSAGAAATKPMAVTDHKTAIKPASHFSQVAHTATAVTAAAAKVVKKKYETIKVLGAGASCKVLLAKHRETGQLFARKVLAKHLTPPASTGGKSTATVAAEAKLNQTNRQYWENETKILRLLSAGSGSGGAATKQQHPNLLELVESREGKTAFYLTTVLYSGGELFDRITSTLHSKSGLGVSPVMSVSDGSCVVMVFRSRFCIYGATRCCIDQTNVRSFGCMS